MTSQIKKDFHSPTGFQESEVFPDQNFIDNLTDNEELVLIKTPIDFDFEKLVGQEISLTGKRELNFSDEKKVVVDVSSFSKQLDNICFLKKIENSNECVPVGVRFKKQIDIYEHYSFPKPVIPVPQTKHVPCPVKLMPQFPPYGADDPVVFYKCKKKKKLKKSKEASPEYKNPISHEENDTKEHLKRKTDRGVKNEEEFFTDLNGSNEVYNTSPTTKKKKKKKARDEDELESAPSNKDSKPLNQVETSSSDLEQSITSHLEDGRSRIKTETAKRKVKREHSNRVKSELLENGRSWSDLGQSTVCHEDQNETKSASHRNPKKIKLETSRGKNRVHDIVLEKVKSSRKVKAEPRSDSSDEY